MSEGLKTTNYVFFNGSEALARSFFGDFGAFEGAGAPELTGTIGRTEAIGRKGASGGPGKPVGSVQNGELQFFRRFGGTRRKWLR